MNIHDMYQYLIEAVINFPVCRLQFNVYTFKLLQNTKFTF